MFFLRFKSLLGLLALGVICNISVAKAGEVTPSKLETLRGVPLVKGFLLTCVVDNEGETPISVSRVEFYYSCRFPQNRFHYRYRCEEAGIDCVIKADDYAEFDGPLLSNCYLVEPVCLIRYKVDPS